MYRDSRADKLIRQSNISRRLRYVIDIDESRVEIENVGTASFEVSRLLSDESDELDDESNIRNESAKQQIFHWQLFPICITSDKSNLKGCSTIYA
ncbi:hypothetical protein RIR_jg24857.t1 [Rhizophagus irregularis DAOM 181602=DAOM 197198]|nr:hypothetical protein RIR_jg24857.t1 [Rhizophagus irregularis DAOM 181602=DAOM 197198]